MGALLLFHFKIDYKTLSVDDFARLWSDLEYALKFTYKNQA